MTRRQLRFGLEAVSAGVCGILALVTIFWSDWIETVFGVDPDHGNGTVEWLAVAVLAAIALGLGAAARREWGRTAESTAVSR
ncbi:MAG TPA: hypothetical protein VG165_16230 [Solirubrobacteraceae bacterium]|jgi:hypothetical protein|nr:hypothetical protein [Solirubrobacteraceae bacterium]